MVGGMGWMAHDLPIESLGSAKNGDLIGFHLGKLHHDRSLFSRTLEIMVRIWGPTIQVSETL
jgi:hypothetical protein